MMVPHEFCRTISKEEINALPLWSYEGPVRLVREPDEVEETVAALRAEPLLGFDTETRPSFTKGRTYPPALIQLATSGEVLIFQLRRLGFPRPLRDLLADPAVVKAGVAVRADLKELKRLSPFEEAGCLDLAEAAKRCGMKTFGLRNLSANLLGLRISKTVRTSNWAADELTPQQIAYAATDAWISRVLCERLRELGVVPAPSLA